MPEPLQNALAVTMVGDANPSKDTDAVLIFDGEGFRLELLSSSCILKRDESQAAQPSRHMQKLLEGSLTSCPFLPSPLQIRRSANSLTRPTLSARSSALGPAPSSRPPTRACAHRAFLPSSPPSHPARGRLARAQDDEPEDFYDAEDGANPLGLSPDTPVTPNTFPDAVVAPPMPAKRPVESSSSDSDSSY